MLKLNAKRSAMKLSIFIISVISISCQLSAQTNNKNHSSERKSPKTVKASELKKKDFKQAQVTSKKKVITSKSSEKISEPKTKSKSKTILKPEQ